MEMDFNEILKIFSSTLPFIALCLVNTKINLNKTNRAMQFGMPVVTLIYVLAGILLLDRVNVWVHGFLMDLANKLEFLNFLLDVPWDSYMIYVMNTVFVLVFIILKFLN